MENQSEKPVICFLCTGNAARSVMARIMFEKRAPNYVAIGAGTLVLEGHPMSQEQEKHLNVLKFLIMLIEVHNLEKNM